MLKFVPVILMPWNNRDQLGIDVGSKRSMQASFVVQRVVVDVEMINTEPMVIVDPCRKLGVMMSRLSASSNVTPTAGDFYCRCLYQRCVLRVKLTVEKIE